MESSGLSRCVCPEEGQGAALPRGPSSRDGFDSGVLKEVPNDLRACIRAGRPLHKRGLYVTQTKTKTTAPIKNTIDNKYSKWPFFTVIITRRDAVGRLPSFLPSCLPSFSKSERQHPTKPRGWYPQKVPSESRFRLPSPRYSRFSVLGRLGPQRPKMHSKCAPAAGAGC